MTRRPRHPLRRQLRWLTSIWCRKCATRPKWEPPIREPEPRKSIPAIAHEVVSEHRDRASARRLVERLYPGPA